MDLSLTALLQHGYLIVIAVVFLESVGVPIPAALVMLFAGSACAQHQLNTGYVLASAIPAMLAGDTLMYLMGRYTGWWLLGILCRLSLQPEACIFRSAESFYRRGRKLLLIAKFLPGINTMAAPLAGSMRMRASEFLRLDSAGAVLYLGAYFSVGYAFSGAIGAITKGYKAFGHLLGFVFLVLAVLYVGWQVALWLRSRSLEPVPSISPRDAAGALSAGEAVIYDVRSHGYYERNATRIQGSKRLEPTAARRETPPIPDGRRVLVYCTCVRQATSARVARELLDKGTSCAVIVGGLREWKKAGLPMESVPEDEIAALPAFDM
jgi:membrane protein DedA with SNARE-associated domain/rhodanese-related sulfurtransferase